MSSRMTTTAAAVAAATALAAGAYALGTESDGSAQAAKANATATPSPGKQRVALKELRGTQPGDLGARHAALLSSVAKSLGVSEAEVKAAFAAVRKQVRPGFRHSVGPDGFAAALAKQLGVSKAKVES